MVARHTLLVILASLLSSSGWAQQHVILVDHAAGKAWLGDSTCGSSPAGASCGMELKSGDRIETAAGAIKVRVVNTNTALYSVSLDADSVIPPGFEPLRRLREDLKGYIPDIMLAAIEGTRGLGGPEEPSSRLGDRAPTALNVRAAWSAGRVLESALVLLDEQLIGSRGVFATSSATLRTIEAMRGERDVESVAARLRKDLGLENTRPVRLPLTGLLLTALDSVTRSRSSLAAAASLVNNSAAARDAEWVAIRPAVDSLEQRAAAAVEVMPDLIDAAYGTEGLALRVAYASSSQDKEGGAVRMRSGRTLSVRIQRRPEPELARAGTLEPMSATYTLLPRWRVRPSVGGALVIAPGARYGQFGTRTVTGGAEVVQTGTSDQRFTWGLSAALEWPLGRPQKGAPDFAIALPEIMLNPSTSARAFGVGAGLWWRGFRASAGALWVKHTELDGFTEGEVLPNKDFLRTRETYAGARVYFALAITTWPFGL